MTMGLDSPAGPMAEAPADRPSLTVEQWAQQGLALLFGDNKLDMNERRILKDLFLEIQQRAMNGGIGNGTTPPAGADPNAMAPGQSPQEMNQNVQDDPNFTDDDGDEQQAGGYSD